MCQQTLPFSGLWIVSAFSKVDVRAMREGECADLTAHFIRIRVVMDTNVPEVAAELFFHFLAHVILHGLAPLLARHDLLFRSEERRVGKECRTLWWATDGTT